MFDESIGWSKENKNRELHLSKYFSYCVQKYNVVAMLSFRLIKFQTYLIEKRFDAVDSIARNFVGCKIVGPI